MTDGGGGWGEVGCNSALSRAIGNWNPREQQRANIQNRKTWSNNENVVALLLYVLTVTWQIPFTLISVNLSFKILQSEIKATMLNFTSIFINFNKVWLSPLLLEYLQLWIWLLHVIYKFPNYKSNINVFCVSEFSKLERFCCHWWQCHEEEMIKMACRIEKCVCFSENVPRLLHIFWKTL